ncbi:Major facilitator superfamily [Macrophomina phaseolina MS6]|uniref:Major facilitator superfamily n=1 Tax=Macrophomina phaseolina (strain MS6) TaxID=1126212 RepID=K2S4N7_MACPH|nr:Major facilitator superfamily [Macrophomina phaseolina MS6]
MVRWLPTRPKANDASAHASSDDLSDGKPKPAKWSLGILNDKETDEVPGSVLLLSRVNQRNEPLGLRNAPARTSSSSLPSPYPPSLRSAASSRQEKKRTPDGKIILDPQPDESHNDPLNWRPLRRDAALLSLGFYCMLGGGMTPILAAGFNNVAETYDTSVESVALTTGLYMLGLGLGSVVASPTAILYGKRPVYLAASVLFVLSAVWCALSPSYTSLLIARIVQGIAVSPVECLPSATIAEIFFLHERAYRLGVYTLLLLGGKNLVPLVSAAIIQSLGWRWVFWVIAIIVGFGGVLLFFFVPETFWDRTPRPRRKSRRSRATSPAGRTQKSIGGFLHHTKSPRASHPDLSGVNEKLSRPENLALNIPETPGSIAHRRRHNPNAHVGFAEVDDEKTEKKPTEGESGAPEIQVIPAPASNDEAENPSDDQQRSEKTGVQVQDYFSPNAADAEVQKDGVTAESDAATPVRSALKSPQQSAPHSPVAPRHVHLSPTVSEKPSLAHLDADLEAASGTSTPGGPMCQYTDRFRSAPKKTYWQTLAPYSGRLRKDNWFRVMARPFILFAYPAVLWSTVVYSLSIGWLIVLSESVSSIYRDRDSYNFTALQCGLVYISPFIGGVLGTAVAGKVSDLIVRWMSRRNDGVYEPEFRLVMALPVAICTTIGLMGFGWSAEEKDAWIVPTFFFGVISFGCSLGSTTSITFCVDSYRQYAGEALVTLNFSKNVFHGFVFSLFFTHWLQHDGPKDVYLAVGGIQLACLLFTIPMYIYGKRARMWTVRKNLMEKF